MTTETRNVAGTQGNTINGYGSNTTKPENNTTTEASQAEGNAVPYSLSLKEDVNELSRDDAKTWESRVTPSNLQLSAYNKDVILERRTNRARYIASYRRLPHALPALQIGGSFLITSLSNRTVAAATPSRDQIAPLPSATTGRYHSTIRPSKCIVDSARAGGCRFRLELPKSRSQRDDPTPHNDAGENVCHFSQPAAQGREGNCPNDAHYPSQETKVSGDSVEGCTSEHH